MMQEEKETDRICILGSSGFIGKNLIKIIDNSVGVSLRSNDWKSQITASHILINLVGKAHDHKGIATERDYYYANVDLLKEIYCEFVKSSAVLFIHISSIAAVEEYESGVYLDEESDCHPTSFYGKSKREAEEWLLDQVIPAGKKLIILRPPMIHGIGDKGNLGLLYKFISMGIPYPLSAFNNKRSLISIDNFTFLMREIIVKHRSIESGIYNIADDDPISTKEIIYIIKKVTNKNIPNITLPKFLINIVAKIGDKFSIPLNTKRLKKLTSNLLVSNRKIKMELDIEKLPLLAKEGLEITVKSFNQVK